MSAHVCFRTWSRMSFPFHPNGSVCAASRFKIVYLTCVKRTFSSPIYCLKLNDKQESFWMHRLMKAQISSAHTNHDVRQWALNARYILILDFYFLFFYSTSLPLPQTRVWTGSFRAIVIARRNETKGDKALDDTFSQVEFANDRFQ